MKNFEKHIDSIISTINELMGYYPYYCEDLPIFRKLPQGRDFRCWLLEEYKEPIHLTHDEYVILKNLPSEHKYIVRGSMNDIVLHRFKPRKGQTIWIDDEAESDFIDVFNHLFKFIKWEDEEPYSIQQLIEDYEKEHGDE